MHYYHNESEARMNQTNFRIGEKVTGCYYGKQFIGTITKRECVNNGKYPKFAYWIKLDDAINTYSGRTQAICWIDRDQLSISLDYQLVLIK